MTPQILLLTIAAALALVGLGGWSSAWWYGRKLTELNLRLARTRELAGQHLGQARRQIAQLQQELSSRPAAGAPEDKRADRIELERTRIERDRLARERLEHELDDGDAPALPQHGFADTQPL